MQEKSCKTSVSGTAPTPYREPNSIAARPAVTGARGTANRSGAIDNSSKRTISTDCRAETATRTAKARKADGNATRARWRGQP
jgi:hypothetical protein